MTFKAEEALGEAVKTFWETRGKQQGDGDPNQPYAGARAAVVGGRHADGFISLIARIVSDAGLPNAEVRLNKRGAIPGYFRPCKQWDLVVICEHELVAAVEVKSQVGSFGNNFNNRVEEAIGNATDVLKAYEKGLYPLSAKPWLGYLLMLQEHPDSTSPTSEITLKPFPVDSAFQRRSYAKRYELMCERFVRERLYDAVCFVMSNERTGPQGKFTQPNPELSFLHFARSLHAHAAAYAKVK